MFITNVSHKRHEAHTPKNIMSNNDICDIHLTAGEVIGLYIVSTSKDIQ